MIRRTLSPGPQGRSLESPHSGLSRSVTRHHGFSLIEVMMSLVLMGIGMALALPSYRDMVEKRQITNGAEQLASFINTAQGVAMKTNRLVKVSWKQDQEAAQWCVGAVDVDTLEADPCDCTGQDESAPACVISGQSFVLNQSSAADRDLMHDMGGADSGSYTFDPIRGFSPDLVQALAFEMRSVNGDFRLNLMVNNTGRVILCSSSEDHAVPGYQLCPAQSVEVEVAGS